MGRMVYFKTHRLIREYRCLYTDGVHVRKQMILGGIGWCCVGTAALQLGMNLGGLLL